MAQASPSAPTAFRNDGVPTKPIKTGRPLLDRAFDPNDFMHGELRTDILYGNIDLAVRKLRQDFIKLGLIVPPPAAAAQISEAA